MILKDPNFCFLGLEDYININMESSLSRKMGEGVILLDLEGA